MPHPSSPDPSAEAPRAADPPLGEAECAALARELPAWERTENRRLRRELAFPGFREAFAFATQVALLAEAEGHHPDIEVGWGRAALTLTTHGAGGLTRRDFALAAKIDAVARR